MGAFLRGYKGGGNTRGVSEGTVRGFGVHWEVVLRELGRPGEEGEAGEALGPRERPGLGAAPCEKCCVLKLSS